jgi:hypothetical protein
MKNNHFRLLALLAIGCMLCMALSLPVFAASADSFIEDLEAELPGITEVTLSILSINSLADANQFMSQYSPGILLIIAGVAALMAFFGYRALHFAILLGGFAAGWIVGSALYTWVLAAGLLSSLEPIPVYVPYIIFTILGFVAAFLAMRIIRFGIFLAAAASTYFFLCGVPAFDHIVDQLITEDIDQKHMLGRLFVAVIIGVIALLLTRPIVIITTGAAGGMITAISLMVAVGQTSNINLELVLGLIIALIGVMVQFSSRRKRGRR